MFKIKENVNLDWKLSYSIETSVYFMSIQNELFITPVGNTRQRADASKKGVFIIQHDVYANVVSLTTGDTLCF